MMFMRSIFWSMCLGLTFLVGCDKNDKSDVPPRQESAIEKDISLAISQAPSWILAVTNSSVPIHFNESIRKTCALIGSLTNKSQKAIYFDQLMTSACSVDLSVLNVPESSIEISQRQINRIYQAHQRIQSLAQEIWTQLFIQESYGENLFFPWFKLIEKLRSEKERLPPEYVINLEGQINFVERLINDFYISSSWGMTHSNEVKRIQQQFIQRVGRPLRTNRSRQNKIRIDS